MSLLPTLPGAERTLRRDLLVLIILAALLYFPGLGRRDMKRLHLFPGLLLW